MQVTFLGAVGAIGGNKFLLTDGVDRGSRLLLDFGMQFGDPESYAQAGGLLGSMGAFYDEFVQPRGRSNLRDLIRLGVLPEVEGVYREDWLVTADHRRALERHVGDVPFADYWESGLESHAAYKRRTGRAFVDGVLLTHAHADHFQHLAFLDPEIPIWCTALTRSIVQTAALVAKAGDVPEAWSAVEDGLRENGPRSAWPGLYKYHKTGVRPRTWKTVQPYEWFRVGAFRVQAIPIDHSVPGACFFLIEGGDGKRVLYTGDFRFHGVYAAASTEAKRRLRGLRPDALLCEGTRIDSDHQDSEEDVLGATKGTMDQTSGLVLAEWGWKDATRFLTMQRAAEAAGRTLLVDPRVALMLQDLARIDPAFRPIEGYPNVRVYLRRKRSMTYSPEDYEKHELGYRTEWSDDEKAAAVAYLTSEDGAECPPTLQHYRHAVRADAVRRDPGRYVVQTSYFQINELFDLAPPGGSYYIRSSCEPFNDEMRTDQQKLLNWLSRFGIGSNIEDDLHGHHTSGHVSGSDLAAFWEIVQPKVLFPIHTAHPELYAERWRGDVQPPKYGETVTI